jgi:hypothetical protein
MTIKGAAGTEGYVEWSRERSNVMDKRNLEAEGGCEK